MTFEKICLKNMIGFLILATFYIVYQSIYGLLSVTTGLKPFPLSYTFIFMIVSDLIFCFSALLLLLLRDFMNYPRFICIFVFFKGISFSSQKIKLMVGHIGFEILRN